MTSKRKSTCEAEHDIDSKYLKSVNSVIEFKADDLNLNEAYGHSSSADDDVFIEYVDSGPKAMPYSVNEINFSELKAIDLNVRPEEGELDNEEEINESDMYSDTIDKDEGIEKEEDLEDLDDESENVAITIF